MESLSVRLDSGEILDIFDLLPHGSGINYQWYLDENEHEYILSNGYQNMNEFGYYDFRLDFNIVINKEWDNAEWHRLYELEVSCDNLDVDDGEIESIKDYLDDMFALDMSRIMEFIPVGENNEYQ